MHESSLYSRTNTSEKVLRRTNLGTQFGDVLSTSQVANNFIGNGLWGEEAEETSRRIPPESAMLS